jgi:hypothetical protein
MAETAALSAEAAKSEKAETLDELMLAMDVVDTLRHQEGLVARELGEEKRAAELKERLRDIYKGQGIAVPDHVLEEGVKALRESRFVYTPPAAGWKRNLALIWVRRERYGKWAVGAIAAVSLWWGYTAYTALRPSAIEAAHGEVIAVATADAAKQRAAQFLADGKAALAKGDTATARRQIAGLQALRTELLREYALMIVSRPREASGRERIPPNNRNTRNYYLIVEAIAPDKSVLELTFPDEEQGKDVTAKKFGIRVSREVFDAVRRDKGDDGIVQNARVGEKRRGELEIRYVMPVLGGRIARID